jgi:uncharacterized protein with PQ loop repeat
MHTTEILLVTLGTISVLAAIPQLITLIRIKKSDQFNLFSWTIWLGYQVVSSIYSYAVHAYVYLTVSILWTLFYATMVLLILKFRRHPVLL